MKADWKDQAAPHAVVPITAVDQEAAGSSDCAHLDRMLGNGGQAGNDMPQNTGAVPMVFNNGPIGLHCLVGVGADISQFIVSRCCHRTIPTGSASSLMTTAWWPMPACSCRPPSPWHLGLRELVDRHLDLGGAPERANTGDKLLTLVASALAGGDCIDDADALRTGRTACLSIAWSRRHRPSGPSCAAFAGATSVNWTG